MVRFSVLNISLLAAAAMAALPTIGSAGGAPTGTLTADNVYLLPDSFYGQVRVIHGIRSGKSPERKGDADIFRIPADGVLITQARLGEGSLDEAFFYRRPDGSWERIQNHIDRVAPQNAHKDEEVFVLHGGIAHTRSSSRLDCDIYYTRHSVGTRKEIMANAERFDAVDYLKNHGVNCDDVATTETRER